MGKFLNLDEDLKEDLCKWTGTLQTRIGGLGRVKLLALSGMIRGHNKNSIFYHMERQKTPGSPHSIEGEPSTGLTLPALKTRVKAQ